MAGVSGHPATIVDRKWRRTLLLTTSIPSFNTKHANTSKQQPPMANRISEFPEKRHRESALIKIARDSSQSFDYIMASKGHNRDAAQNLDNDGFI